mmetsp:Transcript_7745/g.34393  ORF Transcript_7745/g.34393 Transcript_7745/m.34393 type:complete len:228 (-) Transcript_7745:1193-1876(-)
MKRTSTSARIPLAANAKLLPDRAMMTDVAARAPTSTAVAIAHSLLVGVEQSVYVAPTKGFSNSETTFLSPVTMKTRACELPVSSRIAFISTFRSSEVRATTPIIPTVPRSPARTWIFAANGTVVISVGRNENLFAFTYTFRLLSSVASNFWSWPTVVSTPPKFAKAGSHSVAVSKFSNAVRICLATPVNLSKTSVKATAKPSTSQTTRRALLFAFANAFAYMTETIL